MKQIIPVIEDQGGADRAVDLQPPARPWLRLPHLAGSLSRRGAPRQVRLQAGPCDLRAELKTGQGVT